jgi:hypothetical protein
MPPPVQPWEGDLPLSRAVVTVACIVWGATAAFAQPAPKLPACSQSMIVGTWQALFAPGASNPIAPGFPIYPNFACPISISANGSSPPEIAR